MRAPTAFIRASHTPHVFGTGEIIIFNDYVVILVDVRGARYVPYQNSVLLSQLESFQQSFKNLPGLGENHLISMLEKQYFGDRKCRKQVENCSSSIDDAKDTGERDRNEVDWKENQYDSLLSTTMIARVCEVCKKGRVDSVTCLYLKRSDSTSRPVLSL